MSFADILQAVAAQVEDRLAQHLRDGEAWQAPERLAAAMRHAVLGGGKRFRPFLLIESAGLFGLKPDAALDAAAALECLHCYSLVHDDLPGMDNDDMRRARPTVHVAFDEATAILTGDTLLTLAFEILARPATHPDPSVRAELALQLARAGGRAGMAGGQMLDLMAEGRALSESEIRTLQAMKTGALITYGCEAGAILASASGDERAVLKRFGETMGLAFQLGDDLLDADGDAARLGKATGKDEQAGKATLVSVLGIEKARALLSRLEGEAIELLKPFGARAGVLAEAARFVTHRQH